MVTLTEITQLATGEGTVERRLLAQALIDFALNNELSDKVLVTLLRSVFQAQSRLVGEVARLETPARNQFFAHLRGRAAQQGTGRALTMLAAVDFAGCDIQQALLQLVRDILRNPVGQASGVEFLALALAAIGLNITYTPDFCGLVVAEVFSEPSAVGGILPMLRLLGFHVSVPLPRREPIFQHIVLPILERLSASGDAEAALTIEQYLYNHHIKSDERPQHHKAIFEAIGPAMRQLGAAHRAKLPALPEPASASPSKVPRLAFLLHNGHRLAHVELMLSFFSGLTQASRRLVEPLVYLLNNAGEDELAASCKAYGVTVLSDGSNAGESNIMRRFEACRAALADHGVDAVVFVSVPVYLDYLTAFKLAPISIWWPMKFPLPCFPLLDGRVMYRMLVAGKVEIEGRTWRGGPLGVHAPPAADSAAVEAVRSRFGGRPLLGTIAREEKIREPGYLEAVTRVLAAHPSAQFLWTGRNQLPDILRYFTDKGVADRCHFVGWVDPVVYCRVFDIFLETFPLAGLMSGWAMMAGKPVVTAGSFGWLGTHLEGIYSGAVSCSPQDRKRLDEVFAAVREKLPELWANTVDEYVDMTNTLIANPALQVEFGRACQRFMREFLCDDREAALIQARHFADVVAEVTAGVA